MIDLARRWLAYYGDDDTSELDSRGELERLIQSNPRQAWDVIMELVTYAPDEKTLASVGAGPIETLLQDAGSTVVDWIVTEASENDRLKLALSHAWEFDIDDDVWKKVRAVFC